MGRKKPNETRQAYGYPDEVNRCVQMITAQKRLGASQYELEYFFQTGKRLPKKEEKDRE
jgi:hypothetical protein